MNTRGLKMGSGNRVKFYKLDGIMLGICFDTHPFKFTVSLFLFTHCLSIGMGKAYDEA